MFKFAGLALLCPLLSFLVISFFTRKSDRLSAFVSIAAILGSLASSVMLFALVLSQPGNHELTTVWMKFPVNINIEFGFLLNPLSAVMLLVVTSVSFLVQVYSMGYMKGDPAFRKYYAFLSLFSFSMIGLVLANNFLEMYIFWEMVGLSSYLLIGHWYHKPEAAVAAKKAFVVTRFGDFGFLVAILILSAKTGTFNFLQLEGMLGGGILTSGMITLVALLMFAGAAGKSAQFPLHVWLPDAMEGPTPVSALIHAATMVAAGIYLVARAYFLFSMSETAMLVIAVIGCFTAFFAGSIALAQDDIKKILAYSTVSQLGYMMLALGVGGYTAGFFHLITHASFKALLFLTAGSLIHSLGTNNIWEMGGLFRKMRITAVTFLIGGLALAGVFPTSGYFSKDAILIQVFTSGHYILFAMSLATVGFTAFYMSRAFFVVFLSTEKFGKKHPHESPAVMWVPLVILSIFALGLGAWTNGFNALIFFGGPAHETEHDLFVPIVSSCVAFLSALLAWAIYQKRFAFLTALAPRFSAITTVLRNKYYIDEFYAFCVNRVLYVISNASAWVDRNVVDGAVNGTAYLVGASANVLRKIQTGRVQNYALGIFGGVVTLWLLFSMVK
ncbi:MAG: NADH-quinone oxidoreductase subunit L [Candidatus Omnitrophica bacterium]|nr:NADH-quinone oxidoreductase subunit L [Candidatus Omnitrophota bacterium]